MALATGDIAHGIVSLMTTTCKVESCASTKIQSLGYCPKHYNRFYTYGDPEKTVRFPPEMNLIQRIQATGWDVSERGCWEWKGRRDQYGYPMIKYAAKQTRVHRAMWEIANGKPIPEGHYALHSCDNPPCMNPEHISTGTQQENMDDMVSKGRQAKALNGRYSEADVRKMRELHKSGWMQKDIAAHFSTDTGTVCRIVNRKLYAWVDDGLGDW